MKKLCVVGGMGPLATAEFYTRFVLKTPAKKDQDHPETLILSDTKMPDRTEAILLNQKEELLNRFKKNFSYAENWGADYIVIPCNTSHYFIDEFRKMTEIPIIDMVDETAKVVKDKVTVLATSGTYKSGVYFDRLKKRGKTYLDLTEEEKKIAMDTIYTIKAGTRPLIKNFPKFKELIDKKIEEDNEVILACTELSLLDISDDRIIDAMDVLIDKAIFNIYGTK